VLDGELVIAAHDRAFQQALDAFDGVGVNIGLDPLFAGVLTGS
jgi:hypothetical protein